MKFELLLQNNYIEITILPLKEFEKILTGWLILRRTLNQLFLLSLGNNPTMVYISLDLTRTGFIHI